MSWLKCSEIPDGVWFRQAEDTGWKWIKRAGERFTINCDCVGEFKSAKTEVEMDALGPFKEAE